MMMMIIIIVIFDEGTKIAMALLSVVLIDNHKGHISVTN